VIFAGRIETTPSIQKLHVTGGFDMAAMVE
jgi:hypothetical protein